MSLDKSAIHILIVDDQAKMLGILRDLLKQVGFFNIDEASDGEDALQKISNKNYNVVFSDWNMAPMTGIDLLRKLREDGNDIPFVMVTSDGTSASVMTARDAGVNGYIVKPFTVETLKQNLTKTLGAKI